METANGQLLLKPSNCVVLGGNVSHLVEKWELTRSLAKLGRHGCGAPPFIAFGEKIQQNVPVANDRSFKSLQNNTAKESENENSEFNTQRNDAIAEAYKSGTKKTFGGGTNKLVDSNVQKILEKGYTEEQANQALKFSRNNLEKALSILKRQDEKTNAQRTGDFDTSRKEAGGRGRGGKVAAGSEQPGTTKPSAKVSLFEFLEDKLPHQQENENSTAKMYSTGSSYNASNSQNTNYGNSQKYSSNRNSERFENNISSSFRKNDKENSYSSKSTSSSGAPTKHQLPNNTAVNTQTSVSHTGNASGSTYSGYNKSAHTSQNYNSRQQASGSQQTRDNRDHSSKYSSHGQYGNNYQSNSSAPYRQNSYHERQKNNYHSSSGQQQPYQKQGSPPQQQQQQQPHYASQQKYSQGNQSAGSYQRVSFFLNRFFYSNLYFLNFRENQIQIIKNMIRSMIPDMIPSTRKITSPNMNQNMRRAMRRSMITILENQITMHQEIRATIIREILVEVGAIILDRVTRNIMTTTRANNNNIINKIPVTAVKAANKWSIPWQK